MQTLTRRTWLGTLLTLSLFYGGIAAAGEVVNTDSNNVAIKGYDPVAYFTESNPVEGSPDFVHEWQGAKWQFENDDHRSLFAGDPERYAPRYGGFCAGGMALGRKWTVDPEGNPSKRCLSVLRRQR